MTVWRPTNDTPLTPLRTPFGLMADSVDAEIAAKAFNQYATKALMDAVTGNPGQHATVYADPTTTNNGDYAWSGGVWVATAADSGWLALPFNTGWTDYIPATWGSVAYRKEGSRVTLRGVATSNAGNTLIATLPVGFRPAFSAQFTVQLGTGTSGITIDANGIISMSSWPGGTVTVSVGHLSFLVG